MKLCPFDHFNPCKESECGVSVEVDGNPICSLAFASHELFIIADAVMQKSESPIESTKQAVESQRDN